MCGDEFASCELKKTTHDRAIGLFNKLPIIQEKYINDIEGALNAQKAIDEANPSDAVIMRILNAIGYEEESWIPIVRKNLEAREE